MQMKYSFTDDYSEGAHPKLLEALARTNLVQEIGYGDDRYCKQAAELIRSKIENPRAAVHFLSGGTQANMTVLAAALAKPYESVIAPKTAHINVHETGAVEATGHKIHAVPAENGKIRPEQIVEVCEFHTDEHMVKPRAVYISNTTELGSIYTKSELEAIAQVCREKGLYLYLDGARLGSALTAPDSDLSLPELSQLVDAFYIGGTKNGALIGEAVVIVNPELQSDFRYHIKQRGGLLAKGRLIGVQFIELFKDNLYFELAKHANTMAGKLREGIQSLGYAFYSQSTTNQLFPILPDPLIEQLQQSYGLFVWVKLDRGCSAARLVTSWATPENAVDEFLDDLRGLSSQRANPHSV